VVYIVGPIPNGLRGGPFASPDHLLQYLAESQGGLEVVAGDRYRDEGVLCRSGFQGWWGSDGYLHTLMPPLSEAQRLQRVIAYHEAVLARLERERDAAEERLLTASPGPNGKAAVDHAREVLSEADTALETQKRRLRAARADLTKHNGGGVAVPPGLLAGIAAFQAAEAAARVAVRDFVAGRRQKRMAQQATGPQPPAAAANGEVKKRRVGTARPARHPRENADESTTVDR
jgi:hypothetical protein